MAAKRSLFAILIDQPWWVSLLAGAVMYGFGSMLAALLPGKVYPQLIGAAAALPFAGIAVYTGWLRIRRGPPLNAPALLKALRSASPEDMRTMLEEAYARERYEVSDGSSGDLELKRNGYLTLVRFRRWRAQSTGPAAVDELRASMRALSADRGIYITAGAVTDSARKKAGDADIALLDGLALAELVRRTRGARKAMQRAAAEAAKS